MSDQFVEITLADDQLLDSFWLPLYRRSFPDNERVPEDDHRSAVAAPDHHVLVGLHDGEPVSMARYDVVAGQESRSAFAYLMYMAVDERSVSRGNGQRMFAEIVRRVAADPAEPRLLIFEVQSPEFSTATEPYQQAQRRIDFYRRQGADVLEGIDYVQHVPGQPGIPMLIMVRPLKDGVRPEDAFNAAVALFEGDVVQVGQLVMPRTAR